MLMASKTMLLNHLEEFLEKLDTDTSSLFEEIYKEKVALNTVISLLIKKGVFSEEDFKSEMLKIRKRIRDQ
jgi:site-specific recombinase